MTCQEALEQALKHPMPTYRMLANFTGPMTAHPVVRPEIVAFVRNRSRSSYSSIQERAALDAWISSWTQGTLSKKVDQLAKEVFKLLMGKLEVARTNTLSIVYHPWLRLPPIKGEDPLSWYCPDENEPWFFRALQAFLVLITAHPFSDGNGRVARIVFNAYLRHGCGEGYLPVADILRATEGRYEELLALAAVDGQYEELLVYLRGLFASYADFILRGALISNEVDQFRAAVELSAVSSERSPQVFNPHAFPYVISYQWLLESAHEPRNRLVLDALTGIVNDLYQVAEIKYAVCSLKHLQFWPEEGLPPLLLVVRTSDVNGLLIKSRAIKAKYLDTVTLRIALETDNSVANAQLLLGFCLSSFSSTNFDTTLITDILPRLADIAPEARFA